jgi:hypothetical protein
MGTFVVVNCNIGGESTSAHAEGATVLMPLGCKNIGQSKLSCHLRVNICTWRKRTVLMSLGCVGTFVVVNCHIGRESTSAHAEGTTVLMSLGCKNIGQSKLSCHLRVNICTWRKRTVLMSLGCVGTFVVVNCHIGGESTSAHAEGDTVLMPLGCKNIWQSKLSYQLKVNICTCRRRYCANVIRLQEHLL